MRLEEYAYKYFPDVQNLKRKLSIARMIRITTAIYKTRLISNYDKISKRDYLKTISEDEYFRKNLDIRGVPLYRGALALLVYIRCYFFLEKIL